MLAATIKARWVCEQAHQQLKEELGLDHFEGRSWTGYTDTNSQSWRHMHRGNGQERGDQAAPRRRFGSERKTVVWCSSACACDRSRSASAVPETVLVMCCAPWR